jgi:MbtH protein
MSDDQDQIFVVVVNDEERYSIWPHRLPVPAGWHTVGQPAAKQDCLAHIERVWTDMRPKSLRAYLDSSHG